MGAKNTPSTRKKAKTAAKKKSSSLDIDQRARMCVNLSTIDECAERGVIIQDFTTDTEMNEKDNFDNDFHPMLDEQSDEIDGDESLKAPLVEAVTKNSAKQGVYHNALDWSAVLEIIYMNIGCENVIRKPLLQWKFEKPKAKTFGLGSQADWEDLIMEVEEDAKKKNPSRVEVLVEDNYLPALRARLGGKEPP
ncbi:hypothetical protein BU17DRAFT_82451 [Hysterangium stoloniferum]|nr:hypothetical protein BU17DRAFT_82451 [Hysterangium stoloniferum]